MAHHKRCKLHVSAGIKKCWGTLKRGSRCRNKAKCPAILDILPTCQIHRQQVKTSALCKALLDCSFSCSDLLEWEPKGFQVCRRHRENLTTCYFLSIPAEIRCRIYQLLLPNTNIPARFCTSRSLTSHRGYVYAEILRVNRQIHEEATQLLYSTNLFSISASDCMLSMCNRPNTYMQYVCQNYSARLILANVRAGSPEFSK
jgi:hypothetical protein